MSALETATPIDLIVMYGVPLLVLDCNGDEYIPVKPIADWLGLSLKKTRRNVLSGDNLKLYRSRDLLIPPIEGITGSGGKPRATTCIQLSRLHIFIFRIGMEGGLRVREGSTEDEQLMALQERFSAILSGREPWGSLMVQGGAA